MRPQLNLRAAHAVPALGALAITTTLIPGGVLAHAAGPAAGAASPASSQAVQAALRVAHVRYRQPVVVTGRIAGAHAGQQLALEFEPSGSSTWQSIASATTDGGGGYRLSARLDRSGSLRVDASAGSALRASVGSAPAPVVSTPAAIHVGAAIVARSRQLNVLTGHRVTVSGSLRPLTVAAPVELQERRGRRWVTVAHARTGRQGRYALAFTPRSTGSLPVRVRYAGSPINDASTQRLGPVNVYRLAGASWYGPGGSLACGGTLTSSTLGVANKTLPCGTPVTLHYGRRTVRVRVVDRGPYVAGRDYDLTPATKAALGFGDTGTIWATR